MTAPAYVARSAAPQRVGGVIALRLRERRQRRVAAVAMLALGVIGMVMTVQQRLAPVPRGTDPGQDDGPFRATVAVDGSWQLGAAVQALHRGEAFGWLGSFCVAPSTSAILEARLIDLADQHVVLTHTRDLIRDAKGCGSAAWDIVLPPDLPAGRYQLQRTLKFSQIGNIKANRSLPPLAVTVVP